MNNKNHLRTPDRFHTRNMIVQLALSGQAR